MTDWVFARRHTFLRMVVAESGAVGKHFSSYHRLFNAARWSLDVLGLSVLEVMSPFLRSVAMLGWTTRWLASNELKIFGTGSTTIRCSPAAVPGRASFAAA